MDRTKAKTRKASTKKKAPAKRAKRPQAKAKGTAKQKHPAADRYPNLPPIGETLTRKYKGKESTVKMLADGFQYRGKTYKSLSALAKHICGYNVSGPVLFKLVEPKRTKKTK